MAEIKKPISTKKAIPVAAAPFEIQVDDTPALRLVVGGIDVSDKLVEVPRRITHYYQRGGSAQELDKTFEYTTENGSTISLTGDCDVEILTDEKPPFYIGDGGQGKTSLMVENSKVILDSFSGENTITNYQVEGKFICNCNFGGKREDHHYNRSRVTGFNHITDSTFDRSTVIISGHRGRMSGYYTANKARLFKSHISTDALALDDVNFTRFRYHGASLEAKKTSIIDTNLERFEFDFSFEKPTPLINISAFFHEDFYAEPIPDYKIKVNSVFDILSIDVGGKVIRMFSVKRHPNESVQFMAIGSCGYPVLIDENSLSYIKEIKQLLGVPVKTDQDALGITKRSDPFTTYLIEHVQQSITSRLAIKSMIDSIRRSTR